MNRIFSGTLVLSTVFALLSCSRPSEDSVRVSFNLQKARARGVLPNAADYPCFGLIVTGEGIPSLQAGTGNRLPADHCPYAGAASRFVPLVTSGLGSTAQVEALVPAGRNRLIQVVALEYSSAAACPDGTVAQFIRAGNEGTAPSGYGGLYEVGYVVRDLFNDTEIQVPKIYDSATAQNLRGCSAAPLSLSPSGSSLQVRKSSSFKFVPSGGVPPYSFTMTGTGTLDALGNYAASASPSMTATITVTDAVGNMATTSLTTFSRVPPVAWYAAESFGNATGTNVTSWTSLGNSGSLSLSGTAALLPSAVNGFPAVRVDSAGQYSVDPGTGTIGAVHAAVVARVAGTSGHLFCIAASATCTGSFVKLVGSGNPTGVLGGATDSINSSITSTATVGNGFFLAQLSADLNTTGGVQLITSGGTLTGSIPGGYLPISLVGTQTILLAAPTGGSIDLAEVVIDYASTSINAFSPTIDYLKAKYALP